MEISERLRTVLDYLKLNSSEFADKLNVQRSNISHLLAGRNKPSVDFLSKLIQTFPSIDVKWLITGEGNLGKSHNAKQSLDTLGEISNSRSTQKISLESKLMDSFTPPPTVTSKDKKVTKVILIYNDNTFDVY